MSASNPLLDFTTLPRFADLAIDHIQPAIEALLEAARAQWQQTASTPPLAATWEGTLAPLDLACEQLSRAWGVVQHLHSVQDSEALRTVYNACLPKVTEFWSALGQDERLYGITKAIAQSPAAAHFSPARQRVLHNALRGFRLGGAELPAEQKPRFAAIQERQAALAAKFSENVLDATHAFEHLETDATALEGLPAYALEAAQEAAKAVGKTGYRFTLQFPSYFPVMQYAANRSLRQTLYEAYAKRAAEFGPAQWDNSAIIQEILQLRQEEAQMLGYRHFGDVSLVPKMAQSPEEVLQFLRDLGQRAKPFAQQDLRELREFAKAELNLPDLQSWDLSYAAEKLKEKLYAFSDVEVRQYFREDRVLEGLFSLTESLFGVRIVPAQTQCWHTDVRFYEVQKNSETIAAFYLDPYAREGKKSGAWMDDARSRKRSAEGQVQTPVAYLVCNFSPPSSPGKPSQLSHDDVQTLFHEFGHGLHHMLTEVDELDVSGIHGVEWDAVELPSQFMENFAWEWSVVESLTQHEGTGQPMPKALFEKMLSARNFHSGLQTLRQVEFSMFDMLIHTELNPNSSKTVLDVLHEVRQEVAVLTPPAYNRFPHSFSHIFAGGYAAGYYSYKWAEVLSSDAFALFEETGVTNANTGLRFVQEILAVGGSRPAAESFKAFRGREPSIDALLRHCGMLAVQ